MFKGQTFQAYHIQIIAAVIGFFDIFALGFMQSFVALFVSEEFGVNLIEATFWMGIATLFKQLSYAALSPIWGWLSDRVGSKKMLLRVMAGHALAHFLMFFSRNVYEFTAFLCLDGALGSMSTPIFTLLSKTVEHEKLPQVLSYQQSVQTVGTLLAPGVGVALALEFGYRPTYLLA
ncbi:MFS transporter, partial [Candidatus Bathyarchaeota archaeon]|nr:MFS transporter [Candidatus Bathyarchaeota archaeon]